MSFKSAAILALWTMLIGPIVAGPSPGKATGSPASAVKNRR
jgi:hypothetical protein